MNHNRRERALALARNASRLLMGGVFLFSGFTKLVDPLGFQYKIGDYLTAFGLDALQPLALAAGIAAAGLEFVAGFCLISNLLTRLFAWVTACFMAFFTALTLILALTNPVSDCGCFGDALILTNWQTFGKNVAMLPFTAALFAWRGRYASRWRPRGQALLAAAAALCALWISLHSLRNLPLVDYRPYHVGQDLALASDEHPQGAPRARFATTLLYEKDGATREFALDALPDSTWEWRETINTPISEGYRPPVHDLHLTDTRGDSYTAAFLAEERPTLFAVVMDLSALDDAQAERYNEMSVQCMANDMVFVMLTSSAPDACDRYAQRTQATYTIANADPITLKTIIRSDGGLVLMRHGTILAKWHRDRFMEPHEISRHTLTQAAFAAGHPRPMALTGWYMLLFLSAALLLEYLGALRAARKAGGR